MVDVQGQLSAVQRSVSSTQVDGAPARAQSLAQRYGAPIDDVWSAVTDPERIARWFLPVSGDLRLGGRYQTEGNAGGEILECEPPADGAARYRVTWEFGGGMSWLTLRLASDGPGTRLELEHVAREADVPEQMWQTFGPGATGVGWDGGLLGLALHLSAPDSAMTPEEGQAWTLSAEGKAFNRGAADAWAEAAILAGTDRETARRQADATYGFYAGEPAAEAGGADAAEPTGGDPAHTR
ncbi:SRPBCC domain-containing protein [Agrococcus sp. HG114]|uniref:SRPBCC domain-containing protein n=1 Tax=Agrococcus sp. HG114 TaxID=2969757 RepID=UPI00215A49A3|nr:SRPBCC domain-containing protein [Agrococcus sp. HG114]MCR8670579.1 SRPBCC domain-containing protein [Agrococcus sp. HG114]